MFAHPTAEVEAGASVGEGTRIWHLCHVRGGSSVGKNCVLARGVFIDTDVVIGDSVKIQNYVSVYKGVEIEDGVFVGPHVCFTNDLLPRAVSPNLEPKAVTDWVLSRTLVKPGASIGANSTIRCGITIGTWAMIGAGSVVVRDVPDFALVLGNPARQVGFVCKCGQRKPTLESVASCPDCG